MQDKDLKPQTTNLLMLAEVLIGLDPATKKSGQKCRRLNASKEAESEPLMNEDALDSGEHGFQYDLRRLLLESTSVCRTGELILARDAMFEERYWPVLIARYNDLPIHIRNGQATIEAKNLSFPYAIKVNLSMSEFSQRWVCRIS